MCVFITTTYQYTITHTQKIKTSYYNHFAGGQFRTCSLISSCCWIPLTWNFSSFNSMFWQNWMDMIIWRKKYVEHILHILIFYLFFTYFISKKTIYKWYRLSMLLLWSSTMTDQQGNIYCSTIKYCCGIVKSLSSWINNDKVISTTTPRRSIISTYNKHII